MTFLTKLLILDKQKNTILDKKCQVANLTKYSPTYIINENFANFSVHAGACFQNDPKTVLEIEQELADVLK